MVFVNGVLSFASRSRDIDVPGRAGRLIGGRGTGVPVTAFRSKLCPSPYGRRGALSKVITRTNMIGASATQGAQRLDRRVRGCPGAP